MTCIQIFAISSPVLAADDVGSSVFSQSPGASPPGVELFDLATQAPAFEANPVVSDYLERSGASALPLVLVDGEISLAGRFPTQAELSRWMGEPPTLQPVKKQSDCCGGCC